MAMRQRRAHPSHPSTALFRRTFVAQARQAAVAGQGFLHAAGWLPSQLVAPRATTKRAPLMLASFANHLALGSAFTFSLWVPQLTKLQGVVVQSGSDWVMGSVTPAFGAIMGGFVWGAIFGGYQQTIGARASCLIGAAGLTTGFVLTGAAAETQSLALLYTAGAITGLGNGFAYVPPVSMLMQWFPDRKGLASGVTIAGYGCSSILTSFVGFKLLEHFKRAPEYLGPVSGDGAVDLVSGEGGHLFVHGQEVVVATAKDLGEWASHGLQEGAYLVGTGSTGITETLCAIGLAYGSIMTLSAMQYRYPYDDDKDDGTATTAAAPGTSSDRAMTLFNVDTEVATRSPQFWLMYSGFGLAATGAYGFIGAGKVMVGECFGDVVSPEFAAAFVAALGAGNLAGRIGWTTASDYFASWSGGVPLLRRAGEDPFWGRKMAFTLMFSLPMVLYPTAYWCVHQPASQTSLYLFTGAVLGVLSSFGGMAATRPALCADLWGLRNGPGVLSARQLSSVLPASFAGPAIVSYFRGVASNEAMVDLAGKCSDADFRDAFLAPKEDIAQLIESKTVTINRLLEICPAGTVDPTPFLYDNALIVLAMLGAGSFATNAFLYPMDKKDHLVEGGEEDEAGESRRGGGDVDGGAEASSSSAASASASPFESAKIS